MKRLVWKAVELVRLVCWRVRLHGLAEWLCDLEDALAERWKLFAPGANHEELLRRLYEAADALSDVDGDPTTEDWEKFYDVMWDVAYAVGDFDRPWQKVPEDDI